ncbi:MAG: hypothetical protein IJ011_04655, partial [Clostridia bacterium]|nr:hypothetical protein [Clostridia bacterium]
TSTTELFDDVELWEPGAVVYETLEVVNEGTLALKYQLSVNVANATATTDGKTLADVLKVGVIDDGATITDRDALIGEVKDWSSLASFTENGDLEIKESDVYTVVIYWEPSENDNEFNMNNDNKVDALTVEIGVNLYATQFESESDSFNNTYDKDAWHPDFVVFTADELQTALNNGGNIELAADIELTETVTVPANKVATLDLNGKTLTGTMHKSTGPVVKNNGTLTLIGGTISSTAANGGSAISNNGKLIVNGTTLNGASNADGSWPSYTVNNSGIMTITDAKITSVHGAVASYGEGAVLTLNNTNIEMSGIPNFTSHGIYTYNEGKAIVNGGNIANNAADQNSTGGSVINGAVEINGGNFVGRIENYYGTPVIKGGTFSADPSKYVADDYKATNIDGVYYVTTETTDFFVNDTEGLKGALVTEGDNAGDLTGELILIDDLTVSTSETNSHSGYGETGVTINGGVFDGNGKTLTVNDANGTWDSAVNMESGTIKNATVNGAFRGIFMGGATGDVCIDNVVIDKVCYTFNSDGGNKDYGVYISNSTLNGWTSYSDVHKEVIFTNCTFGQGTGGYKYAFCRPYNASVFENCVFEEGFEFDTSETSDIVFENCYYGDTLITAENAATLGNGETTFFYNGLNGITIK